MTRHSLPRQGLPVPQGWAHVSIHFLYNYLCPVSIFYEEIIVDYLRGIIFVFVFLKKKNCKQLNSQIFKRGDFQKL